MKNKKYPIPIVRLIISDETDKILILKRKNTSFNEGDWCLPGGKIDFGQSVEEAITNELKEETSLKLITYSFLFYQDSLPQENAELHCINLYFKCEVKGNVILNDESSDFMWFEQDEITKYNLVFGNGEALKYYWGKKALSHCK